jgi:hypothetical protein
MMSQIVSKQSTLRKMLFKGNKKYLQIQEIIFMFYAINDSFWSIY